MAGQQPPTINEEAGLGPNWVPVDGPPIIPGQMVAAPPASDFAPTNPRYIQGTIAPNFQHDSSFVDTGDRTAHVPKFDLMPLGPQQNAITASQVLSVVKTTASSGTIGVELQTNGIDNPVQNKLNLIQGSNIALASDGSGGVTITGTASGGGDGVNHGDPVWGIDPAWMRIYDDFTMTVPANLADFESNYPWHGVNGGTGNFNSTVWPGQGFSGGAPALGFVTMINDSTASDVSWLCPRTSATIPQIGWPILDYPGWKMIWVFTVERQFHGSVPAAFNFAQTSLYIGMGNWPGITTQPAVNTTPRPPDFIGLRYDTDTTAPAISDTKFMFEQVFQAPTSASPPVRNNTQGQTFNTGITPTEGVAYRFEMSCGTGGQVKLFLTDGTTTATNTFTVSKLSGLTVTNGSFAGYGLYTTSGGANFPWVPGTKVTNGSGTLTIRPGILQPTNAAWLLSDGSTSGTVAFYPALLPFAAFGNDSQATPTGSSKGIGIDYFSFVWNPGVAGGTGTPNVNKARYW